MTEQDEKQVQERDRRPYERPRVEESAKFETLAVVCNHAEGPGCGPPTGTLTGS